MCFTLCPSPQSRQTVGVGWVIVVPARSRAQRVPPSLHGTCVARRCAASRLARALRASPTAHAGRSAGGLWRFAQTWPAACGQHYGCEVWSHVPARIFSLGSGTAGRVFALRVWRGVVSRFRSGARHVGRQRVAHPRSVTSLRCVPSFGGFGVDSEDFSFANANRQLAGCSGVEKGRLRRGIGVDAWA